MSIPPLLSHNGQSIGHLSRGLASESASRRLRRADSVTKQMNAITIQRVDGVVYVTAIILLVLMSLMTVDAALPVTNSSPSTTVTNCDTTGATDYFPVKANARKHAIGFDITYHGYYKVVADLKTSKAYVL